MNYDDVRTELLQSIPYFLERARARLLSEEHYGISNQSSQKEKLASFLEFVDEKLLKAIGKYKVPESIDENFDVIKDFWSKFLKLQWSYAYLQWLTLYKKATDYQYYEIPSSTLPIFETASYDDNSIMDELDQQDLEGLERFFTTAILKYKREVLALTSIKEGTSLVMLQSLIKMNTKEELPIEYVTWLRSEVLYRYAIFIHLKRVRSDKELLLYFSSVKNMNKWFFGRQKLDKLPDIDELKHVLYGKRLIVAQEEATKGKLFSEIELVEVVRNFDSSARKILKVETDPGKPRYKSKMDLHGRYHKRYITYINAYGYAYSFTNNSSRYIGGE